MNTGVGSREMVIKIKKVSITASKSTERPTLLNPTMLKASAGTIIQRKLNVFPIRRKLGNLTTDFL